MSVEATPSTRYEFTADQNREMAALGRAMHRLALCMGTFGILSLIWGIATLLTTPGPWTAPLGRYLYGIIQGAVFVQMAVWTRGAGEEFERVAATAGADIEHLMAALEQLRCTYGLMLAVIVLALALVALVLIVSLILSSLPSA